MFRARLFAIGAVLIAALAAGVAVAADPVRVDLGPRQIAITFDDAPGPARGYLSGPERASRLIAALRSAGVQSAVFFCNTERFDAEGIQRIGKYAEAGHLIANHTHGHPDLHRVGAPALIADFRRADEILSTFAGFRKWFRFPYLHEGRTTEERDAVRGALTAAGYRSGYVTVDNYDWYMERLFQDAIENGAKVDFDRLRDAYSELLTEGIEFYDALARRSLGRTPRHVLLLHENDLAALFIADLVGKLRSNGWQVIAPDEAYGDPIAAIEPDTLVLGQGRIVALAVASGYAGPKDRWEDEDALKAEFERRGVFD